MIQTDISKKVCMIAALYFSSAMWLLAGGVTEALSNADAVVVGSITERLEANDSVSFDINVLRVLKGEPMPPVVHVDHRWSRKGLVRPSVPTNFGATFLGVWFLKGSVSSGWDVLAVNGPDGILPGLFWPASATLRSSYQYAAGTPIMDMVAFEVASAVESAGRNPEVLLYAVESLNTAAVQGVLNDFVGSPIVAFQSVGLAGLLERGQPSSIGQLARLWSSIGQDQSKSYVLSALRDSFRDTAAASVRQLAALAAASSTSSDLRTATIAALAAIHTRESLPFLASLLASTDPAERMKGVFGLSSFANGCAQQTRDNVASLAYLQLPISSPYQTADTVANFAFRRGPHAEEAALVSFWTSWWSDHSELH